MYKIIGAEMKLQSRNATGLLGILILLVIAACTSAENTSPSQIQDAVDQFFTQTAQVQQQLAPTETIVAAFNQALTATSESLAATWRSEMDATWSVYETVTARAAQFITPLPTLTPFSFPTQSGCHPPVGWVEYTVEPGDSLSALAQEVGITLEEILNANCMNDSGNLFAGLTIYLPRSPITG